MYKVYITRKIPESGLQMLREKGYDIRVYEGGLIPTKQEIISALQSDHYDAVLSLLTDKIDAEVYDAGKSVKIFSNYATGYDNIDIEEAKKRQIVVTNAPGNYSYEVAEHAMALAITLVFRIPEAHMYMKAGKYKGWEPMLFLRSNLKDKTLGLIGAGAIGSHMAKMAVLGFGIQVIYFDVKRNEEIENKYGAKYLPTVEEVLKEADIVSLHVPLLPSTKHLINKERLDLMKDTSILVNTARGAVVDEAALVEALKSKKIAAAGLDVFEGEPELAPGLADLSNVVLTPHIASASFVARDEMAKVAAQNIIDCLEGRTPKHVVNL